MASIQKRGKKHAVVYTYTDQEGQKRQKWETFNTKAEARKRKSAVEADLDNGTFIPPNTTTVEDFLKEFVELYGEKKWGLSIYASNTAMINNYINPLIGNLVVQDINKRTVDKYIQQLQKTAPVNTPYRHAKTEYVTPCTIEKIIKLLRCAFHQAVRWDIIGKTLLRMPTCRNGKRKSGQSGRRIPSARLSTTARMENSTLQSIWLLPAPCGWGRSLA